jgi:hypothetical protein
MTDSTASGSGAPIPFVSTDDWDWAWYAAQALPEYEQRLAACEANGHDLIDWSPPVPRKLCQRCGQTFPADEGKSAVGTCSSCGQRQDTPDCVGREHWLPVVQPQTSDAALVWERLPSGEFAWLRPETDQAWVAACRCAQCSRSRALLVTVGEWSA